MRISPSWTGHLVIDQEVGNLLLAAISGNDFAQIKPHLSPADLPTRQCLTEANRTIRYIYFIQSGIVSVVAQTDADRRIEVGIVGREGFAGLPLLFGAEHSSNAEFVQIAGTALRMPAEDFKQAIEALPGFRAVLLRYAYVFNTQISQSMLSAGCDHIGQRLARWLLMCQDRVAAPLLPLTHDFLAVMLSVRRPGVTDAIHELEGRRLIKAQRGQITVLNRPALEAFAGASYGTPEREFKRLVSAADSQA